MPREDNQLRRRFAIALALSLLAACAHSPGVMRYEVDGIDTGRVWPAAQTREMPRYRMIGQLLGEGNFTIAGKDQARLSKAFRWLVGLDERAPNPIVLQRPQSGMVDEARRILVTDVSRQAVLVFDEAAGRLDIWDRAGKNSSFVAPIAIAPGSNGQILVTDAELKRVIRLSAKGEPIGDFGAGMLKRPAGIARHARTKEVFVSDIHSHDIKVFDDEGRHLRTFGRAGGAPGEFSYPSHLAVAEDRLYVSDTMNARIQVFELGGKPLFQFGQRGLFLGNLVHPKGVAVDAEGNIYVVESYHDHLLVYDKTGRFLMAIGGTGKANGEFYLPAGVWTDRDSRVFVADMFNGRVAIMQFLGGDQ
ncbi:MAG: 6-bladed beta-propeller [Betaproteobacteria bacterium]|nr:6-bladed beta-propeller [Betaproteobacteria bacterium]